MIQNTRFKLEYDEMTIAAIIDPDNAVYEFEDLNGGNDQLIPGVWDDFEVVDEKLIGYDLAYPAAEIERYVKQISTGRYFKGNLTRVYADDTRYDLYLIQVFPEEELITVYK